MGALPTDGRARDELREAAKKTLNALYKSAKAHWPGFQKRDGQLQMMAAILKTLMQYREEHEKNNGEHLAAVEGKTGSGKTLAYGLPALAVAHVTGKQVVISTATVALQQQLFNRDLPNLARVAKEVGIEVEFALLKGRNRYVCLSKLDLQEDSSAAPATPQAVQLIGRLKDAFNRKTWDGDVDNAPEKVDEATWRSLQADRGSCTTRMCQHYKACAFYASRGAAQRAKIVVANHSLVLSTLSTEAKLFDPTQTLFVFDEGHHLPEIAREHFAGELAVRSAARTLERLAKTLNRGSNWEPTLKDGLQRVERGLKEARTQLLQLHADFLEVEVLLAKGGKRFEHGASPAALNAALSEVGQRLKDAWTVGGHLAVAVRSSMKDAAPGVARKMQEYLVELGPMLLRVDSMAKLVALFNHAGRVPKAKWLAVKQDGAADPDVSLHASSMTPAAELVENLWEKVSAGVVTSATLTACGSFEFFNKMTGLNRYSGRTELSTQSPFDYGSQGELRIARMRANPKNAEAFSQELQRALPERLRAGRNGQLVIFASKRQMQACHAALDGELRARVLMQGQQTPSALIAEHTKRVQAGQGSILFGLKSMGEGIDLPGELCEHVYIEKVPFTPPDNPVDEALAEWLTQQDRDPFAEITVPRAGQQLEQWVGRGIRTTTDWASITLFDTRVLSAKYGHELLKGLPPLPLVNECAPA